MRVFVALLFSCLSNSVFSQSHTKVIHWVHGLNGSPASWLSTSGAVEGGQTVDPKIRAFDFYCNASNLGYYEVNMYTAATDVYGDIGGYLLSTAVNRYPTREKDFIISHSQGGLVARRLLKLADDRPLDYPLQFGGIVTFGTSHTGAQILNNINPNGPNMLDPFLAEGCKAIAGGPASENSAVEIINFILTGQDIQDRACDWLSNLALDIYLPGYTSGITDDYMVGSPTLATLSNTYPNIHKVAFYGRMTKGNELWHLASSELFNQTYNGSLAFQNNNDVLIKNKVYETANKYLLKELDYSRKFNNISRSGRLLWSYGLAGFIIQQDLKNRYKTRRDAYAKGKSWLYGANGQWKDIVGIDGGTIQQNGYICECEYIQTGQVTKTVVSTASYADCPRIENTDQGKKICFSYPNIVYTSYQNKPSDAVVLVESAKAFPGVPANHQVEMTDVNHQMLRTSKETRDALLNLLENQHYGSFFLEQ